MTPYDTRNRPRSYCHCGRNIHIAAAYGVWLSFTNWQFLTSTSPHWQGLGAYRAIFFSSP